MIAPLRVPMYEHLKLYELQKQEIDEAVKRVIEKGVFDWGDEVAAFEEEFAAWNSVEHAVSVNSGTAAIKIALLAAGVGRGPRGHHRSQHRYLKLLRNPPHRS